MGGIYIYTHGIWACGIKSANVAAKNVIITVFFFGRWARVEEIMHI